MLSRQVKSYLNYLRKCKQILQEELQLMDSTSPEIINEVERILERKLSATVTQDYTQTGGIEAVVEVLNGVDRSN